MEDRRDPISEDGFESFVLGQPKSAGPASSSSAPRFHPASNSAATPDSIMAAPGVKLIDLVPPKELAFEFHASTPKERKLTITNTHDSEIAFKVMTMDPRAYLVKPPNGLLAKGASVDIQIELQQGLAPDNFRDRFLVQAALPVNGGVNLTKAEWAALRTEQIQEIPLNVVEDLLPKNGGAAGGAASSVRNRSRSRSRDRNGPAAASSSSAPPFHPASNSAATPGGCQLCLRCPQCKKILPASFDLSLNQSPPPLTRVIAGTPGASPSAAFSSSAAAAPRLDPLRDLPTRPLTDQRDWDCHIALRCPYCSARVWAAFDFTRDPPGGKGGFNLQSLSHHTSLEMENLKMSSSEEEMEMARSRSRVQQEGENNAVAESNAVSSAVVDKAKTSRLRKSKPTAGRFVEGVGWRCTTAGRFVEGAGWRSYSELPDVPKDAVRARGEDPRSKAKESKTERHDL